MPTEEGIIMEFRRKIKQIAAEVLQAKEAASKNEARENENVGEKLANYTLAYRHLEDASMRLGKVLQAMNGGVSVYDGKVDDTVVGSPDKDELDESEDELDKDK